MKTTLQIILAAYAIVIFTSCQGSSNEVMVREFIEAYNGKDSIKVMSLLHDDFTELFENDTTIRNKTTYADHYSWGKQMDDRIEFEIIEMNSDTVKIKSKYHCQRDKLLNLGPYISERSYVVRDGKIFKIIENHDEHLYEARDKVYMAFMDWLRLNKKLSFSDFPFNKEGAIRLKAVLKEYRDDQEK